MSQQEHKSPLHEMTQSTPTCLWNDSAAIEELSYSMGHGAVGATCNPCIVLDVLKKEMHLWKDRIGQMIQEMSTATEDQIAWKLVEEISVNGAALLEPIFEQHAGKNGRLSIQTDPRLYRDTDALVDQSLHFSQLAPNMIVKVPVTKAGVAAIEELTYRGVSINATVSFALAQCVAVAEAVERGLTRREEAGEDISTMGPVCTIMVGRVDDWLKVVADKQDIIANPACLEWAGVATFKKAYKIFQQRGYRLRLLSAAFRNHLHWSEFIGGDVVISPPYQWQRRYNASDVEVTSRIDRPVAPEITEELLDKFVDFRRAYDEDGMSIDEFDTFGATARTLRQFIQASVDLASLIRDFMIPDPDRTAS